MNMHVKKLISAGLSEKEAQVYHAGLLLGPTSVLKIARQTGLKRPTVYAVIDSLIAQGLYRIDESNLKKVFVAEHPRNILSLTEEKVAKAKAIIPDLESLFKRSGKDAFVKTYEGLPALQAIIDRFINETKSGEYRYGIGGDLGWNDIDPQRQEKYFKWRERITLDTRFIFTDSSRATLHQDKAHILKNQVKTLPPHVRLGIDITVTPRFVVIMRLTNPMTAVVIEDTEVIETYRQLFLFIWDLI
jgi:DNA-binding MarR family transcriptional regulator